MFFRLLLLLCLTSSAARSQSMDWYPTRPARVPAPRIMSRAAFDRARAQTVLFGGFTGRNHDRRTWTYDGKTWMPHTPGLSPSIRYGQAMTWDAIRRTVVLFGGISLVPPGSYVGDTWTWNGRTWTRFKPSNNYPSDGPTGKVLAGLAFDVAHKRVVCFGGHTGSRYDRETWTWDGRMWRLEPTTVAPPGRVRGTMVYDAARRRIVLFGGQGQKGMLGDTWTWDGKTWKDVTPKAGPSPRTRHAMVYDSKRRVVVLFGGVSNQASGGLSDTWLWDGKTWKPKITKHSPGPRYEHLMVYDSQRDQTLVFGADKGGMQRFEDTWLLRDLAPARAILYGKGCPSSAPLRLQATKGSLPALGTKFVLDLTGLANRTRSALLFLGLSRTRLGPIPLPLDLSPWGMKGCSLLTSLDLSLPVATQLGRGQVALPILQDTNLVSQKLYFQALASMPGVGRLGLVTSNGLEARIGFR